MLTARCFAGRDVLLCHNQTDLKNHALLFLILSDELL